jgi:hypothetical protein
VQPRARPSVLGRGKTLEAALTKLLNQLKGDPPKLAKKYEVKFDSNTKQATIPKRTTTPETEVTPYAIEFNLQCKAKQQLDPAVFAPTRPFTFNSSLLPNKPASLSNVQLTKPGSTSQPLNTTQDTCTGRVASIEKGNHDIPESTLTRVAPLQWKLHTRDFPSSRDSLDPDSVGGFDNVITHAPGRHLEKYPIVPNAFRFGSSHDILASLSKKPILQDMNEKEKRKGADVESCVNEGDQETRNARKEAQKMADLLTARQDFSDRLKPFKFTPTSPPGQKQTQQETEPLPACQGLGSRQTPFTFNNFTGTLPGGTESASSFGTFAFGSCSPTILPVKLEQSLVPPSFDLQKRIDTFPIQAARASPVLSQYCSQVDDDTSASHRSCSPAQLVQGNQDRVKRESSGSPVGQRSEKKIKAEQTS